MFGTEMVGHVAGMTLDFAGSPIRLLLATLPENTPAADVATLRASLGLAFFAAFFSFIIFYLILKLADWPRSMGAFNVWINLPTFDPTTGGDVVTRLRHTFVLGQGHRTEFEAERPSIGDFS